MTSERPKTTDGRKVATTVYVSQSQLRALRELKAATGVPVADYIRQGVEAVLKKHETEVSTVLFHIWVHKDEGYGILVPDLPTNEAEALEETGFRRVESLEVANQQEAQEKFIKWCQSQCPDAKVERIDFSRLKGD